MILVSACLLGENCKYQGGNNYCPSVVEYLHNQEYITVCPEVLGGLSVPRLPVERRGDLAVNKDGVDLTKEFRLGAQLTLALCRENNITMAILKEGSPTCGVHQIYDGSFSGRKIPGKGITTELLQNNGVHVISEDDLTIDQ